MSVALERRLGVPGDDIEGRTEWAGGDVVVSLRDSLGQPGVVIVVVVGQQYYGTFLGEDDDLDDAEADLDEDEDAGDHEPGGGASDAELDTTDYDEGEVYRHYESTVPVGFARVLVHTELEVCTLDICSDEYFDAIAAD